MKKEFTQACQQLADWIAQSQGQSIDIGAADKCAFIREKLFTNTDIVTFEQQHAIRLEPSYRYFLQKVGACRLFIGRYAETLSFVPLDKLEHWSKVLFEHDTADPFPQLILCVGVINYAFFAGFDMNQQKQNFAFFYPDVAFEYWLDDAEFMAFEDWLIHVVQSKGQVY